MNNEISLQLSKALRSTEKIIWYDQPKIRLLSWLDLLIVPFTCLWASMPLREAFRGWTNFAMHKKGEDLFMLLWISMFAAVGLYITIGRFIHQYFRLKTLYYIITNERVIVLSKLWPPTLRSIELNALANISVIREAKNVKAGTIFFENTSINSQVKMNASAAPAFLNFSNIPVFYDLTDVDRALAVLKAKCKEGQLLINEIKSQSLLESYKQLSQLNIKEMQRMQKLDGGSELIETEKLAAGVISYLSQDQQEKLIATHKRLYIGRSIGMLAGVLCAVVFGYNALQTSAVRGHLALESKNWPEAQGKIEKLEIIRSKGAPYLRSFKIAFVANGKNYSCDKYSYADYSEGSEREQYKFATAHKIGDKIDVFYDPKDPENSVLDNSAVISPQQEDMGKFFIGIGILLFSIIVLRLVLFKLKTFEPKLLKSESLAGVIFTAAFLSVWACMFFGGMLSSIIPALMHSFSRGGLK